MKKNFSEKLEETITEPIETVEEPVVEETIIDPDEAIEEPVVEEEIVADPRSFTKTGVVINCAMLNVRAKDDMVASIITVINEGDRVTVNKELKDFYAVTLANGVQGYVKKEFLEIV